ncbi:hypothetical protein Tco_0846113 [Tanacetum coccineum]
MIGTIPTTIPDTTPTVTPPTTYVDTTLTPTEIHTVSPIVPPSPDNTPASNTESDPSEDSSLDRIPPLPTTLPFLSSTDDSSDSDIRDTPPPPTHGTPFIKITLSTQRSSAAFGALCRQVMILAPRQPIPHGRSYRYHPNRQISTSDDSSETLLDSSLDDLSDSSLGHSSSDHSSPALPSSMRSSYQLCLSVPSIPHSSAAITKRPSHPSSASPSRKRSRSSTTSVPISSSIPGALSPARDDLLPPPKRIRSSDFATDLDDCLNESSESSAEIDECIAYVDALRAEGIDVRVVVEAVVQEEVEMGAKGLVKVRVKRVTHHAVPDDIPEPTQEEEAIKAMGQQSVVLLERISELERDNTRLQGTLDVTNQRVSRLQRRELRVCREMRQI